MNTRQLACDVALVEARTSRSRDRLERAREVRLVSRAPAARRSAAGQEDGGGLRVFAKLVAHRIDPAGEPRGHREAVARIADRAVEARASGRRP